MIYQTGPVIPLNDPQFDKAGVRVLVKREDLNHPTITGNKYWKLKYNLQRAIELGCKTILTFGGAYSNHIYSTAAAASSISLKSIGVIRGEQILPYNNMLAFATQRGMRLKFVTRDEYRRKHTQEFVAQLRKEFDQFYLIPEGGTNELAIKGVSEFARDHLSRIAFDAMVLPVGTGGTAAGIIGGIDRHASVIGVSVLKDGGFLNSEVLSMAGTRKGEFTLLTDYHHGGYAKTTPALNEMITYFHRQHDLPLEHVYSGKAMYALCELVRNNYFPRGTTILFLHTGGLQNQNITRALR